MRAGDTDWRRTGLRWLKFIVGLIGIGVQLLVLALLKSGLHLNYLLATALAVETAVVHNFLWHERFTWRDRVAKTRLAQFIKFNLTNGTIFPSAASHSALVEIDPARPNLGFKPHASCLFSLGGTHIFTCACHCAMLRGIRLSSSFQLAFLAPCT